MERKDINYVFEETAKVPKLEQQPYVNPEIMKVIYPNQPKIILEKDNKINHSQLQYSYHAIILFFQVKNIFRNTT